MAADRQDLRLVRVNRSSNFFEVGNRFHRLLIDLFDYIAFLQFCYTTVWINISDNDALHIRRQIKLARYFWSEFVHMN